MWNLLSQFWPHIAKLNSQKIIEIGSLVNVCFAKLDFSSEIFETCRYDRAAVQEALKK